MTAVWIIGSTKTQLYAMQDLTTLPQNEYNSLLERIDAVWDKARNDAAIAINTSLLDANWQTGHYIVEYEQKGAHRAEYGKQLLENLSKDLTRLRGKGSAVPI